MPTTTFPTQSPLHASRSLLCIRNARHLVVSELLPKWSWAEPSKAPPLDDHPPISPGRPMGRWLPATFRLGAGRWNHPQVPENPISSSWQWACAKSWRMRGSNFPPAQSHLCPSFGRGTPAQEHVAAWHFLVFNCLSQAPNEMTCTTICLCLIKVSVHFLSFLKATLKSGQGTSIHGSILEICANHRNPSALCF